MKLEHMDYIKDFREKFYEEEDGTIRCRCSMGSNAVASFDEICTFLTKVANDAEAKTLYDCWNEMDVLLSEGESVETILKRWHTRIESARNTQV